MDSATPKSHQSYPEPRNKGSSGWTVFWTAVFLIAGFAAAGIYFNERMDQLEKKLTSQSDRVAVQAEDTLKELYSTRKEILDTRAESASFAKQFTATLQDLNGLMTKTVNSFSDQTHQLAQAIQEQDQAQQAVLQASFEQVNQESSKNTSGLQEKVELLIQDVAQIKETVRETRAETRQVGEQVAALDQQMGRINEGLSARLTSLTDLTQALTETVHAEFAAQSDSLQSHLQALREASNRSLSDVQTQLASLAGDIAASETRSQESARELHAELAGRLDGYALRFRDSTEAAGKADDARAAALQGTLVRLSDQVGGQGNVLEQGFQTLSGDLLKVSHSLELGMAAENESDEALKAQVADLGYTLSGRTEDLLLALTEGQQKGREVVEQNQAVLAASLETLNQAAGSRMDALNQEVVELSQGLGHLTSTLDNQMSRVAQTITEKLAAAETGDTQQKTQLAETLKSLQEQVRAVQQNLAAGLEKAQQKAADLVNQPQSEDALNGFKSALDELNVSVNSTREQVKTLGDLISRLNTPSGSVPDGVQTETEDNTTAFNADVSEDSLKSNP